MNSDTANNLQLLEGLYDLDANTPIRRVRLKKRSLTKGLVTQSAIANELQITSQTLYGFSKQGIIKSGTSKGYTVDEAMKAICAIARHYREKAGSSGERSKDKSRNEKADADIKEMKRGKLIKTLCLRSDYLANYADAVACGVQAISGLACLNDAQKKEVFKALRSVKLPELEDEF